jgi:26S proteasome regulatory subunit N10
LWGSKSTFTNKKLKIIPNMPLEAAVIMYPFKKFLIVIFLRIDNSEYSRNGDYPPSRLEAQIEAAQYLFSTRRNSNIENSTALMCTSPPTLLVSLTSGDVGRFSAALSSIKIAPSADKSGMAKDDLDSALRIASLALKHRQNINQKQRIIIFVASPLNENPTKVPEELLKSLKKNGISLNFISIGNLLCLLFIIFRERSFIRQSFVN